MWSHARCWIGGLLVLSVACGGTVGNPSSAGKAGEVAELEGAEPADLPSAPAPPAPAVMATGEWNAAPRGSDSSLVVYTDPGEIPRLELATAQHERLPLEHTHVKAMLTGFVAEVEVTQTYKNPHARPIEAVYVFPLPENSAINRMRMVIDRRVIEAKIDERGRARRTYESAKRQGHTAALLEQERANVFTQSVANIEPGKKIDVTVRYVQDLTYDAGEYEFVFPMVVGPRYFPGQPLEGQESGGGTRADTTRVPDASRISPPYVGKGDRTGHDISLELSADAGLAIGDFQTPTHEVMARRPADGSLQLTLAEKKSLPNRDFVLRYRVAEKEPKAVLYTAADGRGGDRGGYFSLVLEPPDLDIDRVVGRREFTFVVDVSGSMSGVPLGLCKAAMRDALMRMRPVDTFNILTFAGATRQAFQSPRPANSANVREAFAVVDGMNAGGGTEMLDAVAAALKPEGESGRDRYVFFLTDGYVGNENEILSASEQFVTAIEKSGRRARVFGYGVGSSVNRYLIDGLSRAGKGLSVYAGPREDPARAVNQFFHYVDRVVLTDLEVDWGAFGADQVMPSSMPDLFASHPVILHGRYKGNATHDILLRGKAQDRVFEAKISPQKTKLAGPTPVLGLLWARSKVASLEQRLWEGSDAQAEREIAELGLNFGLVTRFTSFVAVDSSRRVSAGNPDRVDQLLEQPEGVDVEMAGGGDLDLDAEASVGLAQPEAAEGLMAGQASAPVEPRSESMRGCGCRTVAPADSRSWPLVAAAIALLFARRRHSGVRSAA